MTKEQAEAETKYRLARCVFSTLREKGLITDDEFRALLCSAARKYHPMIGELEVNSIAGEKGYKD